MDATQLQNTLMSSGGSPKDEAAKMKKKGRGDPSRKSRGQRDQTADYEDKFTKLQDGQPPVLETMIVRAGVTLEAQGQKAVGPDLPDQRRTMSRISIFIMLSYFRM